MKKRNCISWTLYATIALLLFAPSTFAQNQFKVESPPEYCYDPAQPLPLSDFVTLASDDNIVLDGLQIVVSNNYDPDMDSLRFETIDEINDWNYNHNLGILNLQGEATMAIYKQALSQIFFVTTSRLRPAAVKEITVSLSNADYYPLTGHFYQFFSDPGVPWNNARTLAESKSLFGLQGYLTTITTTGENQFILDRVSGTAWIGASDAANDGDWRWVSGPEALENNGTGLRLNDGFRNWENGEPNDCCSNQTHEEDYAHMMDWSSPPGKWNDLPNEGGSGQYAATGYIVEYGGRADDPNVVVDIITTTLLDPAQSTEITGPISVCPNVENIEYAVDQLEGYSYLWSVEGGVIASGQGTASISVNWGVTNPLSRVRVELNSGIICTDVLELPVIINAQLMPTLPMGPDVICFDQLPNVQTYSTSNSNGSTYDWHITNGQILNGNGTNIVEVLWDGPGTGELYFIESTTTSTDICDGTSPTLLVDLREEITYDVVITNVSCFGGSDGVIEIINISGKEPYNVSWFSRGLGVVNGNSLSGLPIGSYVVTVDADGCSVMQTITIAQPEELQGTVQTIDALCFGEASGIANAAITGGTGAYTYRWNGGNPTVQSTVNNLPAGNHSVVVTDENDCSLELEFTVGEPPLLVIDEVISTLVTCPEGSDGTLEALVSGGTTPYTFSWESSTSIDALATGFAKGTYEVTVTDANGCIATNSQEVEEATPKILFPTAFSPNGDGMNDTFGPSTFCPFQFTMTVYDRWGLPIFHTNDTAEQWDGTIDGSPAPMGNYTYAAAWVIVVNDVTISDEKRDGFRLIR